MEETPDARPFFVPIDELLAWLIRVLCGSVASTKGAGFDVPVPRIYFANHSSNLDFPVVWACLPTVFRRSTRPIAAADYWQKGILRRFLSERIFRAVYVERRREHRAEGNPLQAAEDALSKGSSVIIFPEGTRSRDGTVVPFKSGLYHLSMNHPNAELVPVYLHNLNRILPKGEVIALPVLTRVIFGKVLERRDAESKEEFLERARTSVVELRP